MGKIDRFRSRSQSRLVASAAVVFEGWSKPVVGCLDTPPSPLHSFDPSTPPPPTNKTAAARRALLRSIEDEEEELLSLPLLIPRIRVRLIVERLPAADDDDDDDDDHHRRPTRRGTPLCKPRSQPTYPRNNPQSTERRKMAPAVQQQREQRRRIRRIRALGPAGAGGGRGSVLVLLTTTLAFTLLLLLARPQGAAAGAYNPPLGEDARLDQIDDYPGALWVVVVGVCVGRDWYGPPIVMVSPSNLPLARSIDRSTPPSPPEYSHTHPLTITYRNRNKSKSNRNRIRTDWYEVDPLTLGARDYILDIRCVQFPFFGSVFC